MSSYQMTPSERDQYFSLIAESSRFDKLCRMAVQDRDFGAAQQYAATAAQMMEIAHSLADGQAPAL